MIIAAMRGLTLPPQEREDGFTLVEVLVVIIIIGILAAIAVPIFLNQRKAARDAAIITDTRNAGTQMTSFLNGKTADDIGAMVGKTTGVDLAFGAWGAGRTAVTPSLDWNNYEEVPTLALSPGSHISVTMWRDSAPPLYYPEAQPGDFCISADNSESNYNHSSPDALGAKNYDKLVFYDVQLGGVKFMDDLVEAIENDQPLSCKVFAQRYLDATG